MSIDKNYINGFKSRNKPINLQLIPDSKYLDKNLVGFQNKKSINYNNNIRKSKDNNNIETNNDAKKYNIKDKDKDKAILSIGSSNVNSTIENTINSTNSKNTVKKPEIFYYIPSTKTTLNSQNTHKEEESKKRLRIKELENEDSKFIVDIFYKYNNSNFDTIESRDKKSLYNINDLRKYLLRIEKNFKNEGNILIYQGSKSEGLVIDFYFIKKLESLVARFSLIIFIFIQSERSDEAREIFLLMIKENKIYIDYIEKKIMEYYSIENKNINISKDYPRMTYELLRIYSFIIKYSQLFNMMNYRNIFLGRYFEMLFFIYNFFIMKGNQRCFNLEIKNQLSYWFSFALHNVTYYTISNYCPMNLSIDLSKYIIHLYYNLDENSLTDSEKSLIIKTLYNLGLFYYLDGKKDDALIELRKAQERIADVEIEETNITPLNLIKKESVLINPNNLKSNLMGNYILEDNPLIKRFSSNCLFVEKIKISNNNLNKYSTVQSSKNVEVSKNKDGAPNIIEKICEGFKKKKNDLEDIKLLISYGVRNGLITEKAKPEYEYRQKFRKVFRGSHINLSTTFRMKDFVIPYYFNNPLLRKIELLMGEIEIDRKNYTSAYAHVLRAFYILISLKINKTSGNQKEFSDEQKIIDKYLTLIEKYRDEEIKLIEQQKSDQNFFENNDSKLNFSVNNSLDSIQENNNDNLKKILVDKYNLDNELSLEDDEENQEILVCRKKDLDNNILKEIEKFFLFLCSLSFYQIKILNETQPDNVKRNDLPILFPSQFKDCLTKVQRIELETIQTMALSRFIILRNPDRWIMPNNLNIELINKNKIIEKEKELKHNRLIKFESDEDLKFIPIRETREYKYYKKILFSEKTSKEIRKFMDENFELVLKLLKQLTEEEIQNILNFPYIIVDPVKNFKRKIKKKLKKEGRYNEHKNIYNNFNFNYERESNLRFNRNNYDYDDFNSNNRNSRIRTMTIKSKFNRLNFSKFIDKKNIKRKIERNSTRTRHNTMLHKFGCNINGINNKDEKKDNRDYNDSYEEFLLSPENSFDDNL